MNSLAHPRGEGRREEGRSDGPKERRTISKDDAFHLLQNGRRRAVLRYIVANPAERYEMRTLAEAVAAWEHDTTVAELTSSERQRVYIALYQSHLPKLADLGVIEYDQDRGVVVPTALLAVLEPYLGDGRGVEDQLTATDDRSPAADTANRLTATISALLFPR